jgi:hypothetical protein
MINRRPSSLALPLQAMDESPRAASTINEGAMAEMIKAFLLSGPRLRDRFPGGGDSAGLSI